MENFIMSISIDTKAKIKLALDNAVYALNNKKTNSSDCDWIFDDCKEMIIEAVNHKVSLSTIIKAITTSAGSYTHTNDNGTKKELKVTSQKLAKWLKGQGIKRRVHRRAKKTN